MPIQRASHERNITGNHEGEAKSVLDKPEQSAQEADLADIRLSTSMKAMSLDGKPALSESSKPSRNERYAAQVEADSRSIFVGNITSEITPEIIEEHFKNCGNIKRITLLYDKNTGAPKGYAYVEFNTPEEQGKALEYNGSHLKETIITVYKKRTNLPGYHRRFRYQNSTLYYQQQWGSSENSDQPHGNTYRQVNFEVDHSQSFAHHIEGHDQRRKRRGNGRQAQDINQWNGRKSPTSKDPSATPYISSIERPHDMTNALNE